MALDGCLRIAFGTQEFVTEPTFDSGIASYIHRAARTLVEMGHDVHVITLSTVDQAEFDHEGVKVHRVPFGNLWLQMNRLTRYRLTTTMHLLAASTGNLSQVETTPSTAAAAPWFSFPIARDCGLVSMIFLRVPHVLRASWYEPAWNASDRVRRTIDSSIVAFLEQFQFALSPHVYAPSIRLQKILIERAGLKSVHQIPSPFFLECSDWDYSILQSINSRQKVLTLLWPL